jgi:hypothetical protein
MHPMVALSSPGDPCAGYVHVGLMTHTEIPNGGSKPESTYGLPGDGYVLQTYHIIPQDKLQLLPTTQPQVKRDHIMSPDNLRKLKADTEANKHKLEKKGEGETSQGHSSSSS